MDIRASLPALIVGFDTETTGLDTNEDEIISYGFAVFRNGHFVAEESGQFFADTAKTIHPRAQEIHGLSIEELRVRTSNWGGPYGAVEGLALALKKLEQLRNRNAVFVGAFPKFDFDMLGSMAKRHLGLQIDWSREILEDFRYPEHFSRHDVMDLEIEAKAANSTHLASLEMRIPTDFRSDVRSTAKISSFMSSKKPWPRVVDVCAFDRIHWPDITRRRGLGSLCDYYNVEPGRHDALQDARAAVEVWMRQMQVRIDESAVV